MNSTGTFDIETIYALLPAYLRTRDEQLGQARRADSDLDDALARPALDFAPLRALIGLFAEEIGLLQDGTAQMYDDLFIETCAEWVVPYIGELVGARLPPAALRDELDPRALVADTIADRRRKGTIGGLERVADAAVGSWVARATEYWSLLIQSQNLNHLRADNIATFDAADSSASVLIDTPFDVSTRSVDSTSASEGGRYNIANVGIDMWRTVTQRRQSGRANRIDGRRLTFDPFGRDIALHIDPEPVVGDVRIGRQHVPRPLSRREMHENLTTHVPGDVEVVVDGTPLDTGDIVVCLLADDSAAPGAWLNAGVTIFEADAPHDPVDAARTRIDPELGRIITGENIAADARVEVTYHYGSAVQVGAGSLARPLSANFSPATIGAATTATTAGLASAVIQQRDGGLVVVSDSDSTSGVTTISVDGGASLAVVAADGEAPALEAPVLTVRLLPDAELVLDGLWIDADIHIVKPEAGAATLVIRDCTVRPGRVIHCLGPAVTIDVQRSVIGGVALARDTRICATNCIVDATSATAPALTGTGGTIAVHESTVLGRIDVDVVEMFSNSIAVAERVSANDPPPVRSRRRQVGCVRFSWLPFDSEVPQRYRCVPQSSDDATSPIFVSTRHGDARYLQLDGRTPPEITQGSDQDSELGVGHRLHQNAREIVLRDRLDEFLRFGMEAGIHHAS